MGTAGTDGTPTPEAEDGNEFQNEQPSDDDRRRQPRWSYDITGEPLLSSEQLLPQPTRPDLGAARPQTKPEPLPSNWPDILAERLTKLTDPERAEYDRQLYNVMERNNYSVSPEYQLDLAALLNQPLAKPAFGSHLSKLNRREDDLAYERGREALKEAHAHRQRSTEQTRAPSTGPAKSEAAQTTPHRQPDNPSRPSVPPQHVRSAATHDAGSQRHRPSPRKAVPDRTTLARKRLNHLLHEHAERRKELNLPLSRAAQNEIARLDSHHEAERKALLDLQSKQIQLLDYQHLAECVGIGGRWLARDLKQRGSPDAAHYEKEANEALRAAGFAYDRRKALVANRADHHGWDRAASTSTYAPPSQTKDGPTRPSSVEALSFQPAAPAPPAQDPTAFFKDASGAVLTEDRLRAMLGRYQELRQNLAMPSGPNETNEQSHLASAQAIVRTNLHSQQDAQSQLLAQKHLGERAGTSSQWMARDTDQLSYKDAAHRAFRVAWHAMDRSHAIDPRAAAQDRMRAINNDQEYSRQSAAQEAAKGGRPLSADERANLPTEAARGAHDRSNRTGERFQDAKPGHQKPGRGSPNARGGGGRGR